MEKRVRFCGELGQQLCGDPALLSTPEMAAAALPSLSEQGTLPPPSSPAVLGAISAGHLLRVGAVSGTESSSE